MRVINHHKIRIMHSVKAIHYSVAVTILFFLIPASMFSQDTPVDVNDIKPTDFSLPPAPAYLLLDANSPLISKPGVIRDFKVDWSLKS